MKPTTGGAAFLTPSEVAAVLRLSRPTVYALIKAGQIDAVRAGKSYRIPRAEFEARFGLTAEAS